MLKAFQIFFKIIIGIIFSIAAVVALTPLLASWAIIQTNFIYYGVILFVVISAGTAPTIRRAFGRSFLILGVAIFLLPISILVLSGAVMNETVDSDNATSIIGGVIASGVMTMFAGFVGFSLGTISLITGLVLSFGGRREVIIVENRTSDSKQSRNEPTFR